VTLRKEKKFEVLKESAKEDILDTKKVKKV